jgi:hypothetical protein
MSLADFRREYPSCKGFQQKKRPQKEAALLLFCVFYYGYDHENPC